MNYYNLSPKTTDRTDKLSLEELHLCAGPQTCEQGNPIVSAPNIADSPKPPLVTDSSSVKHNPLGKVPSKIHEKAPTLLPAKGTSNHVKIKDIQKQSPKKRSMNFKPLFKLLESDEYTAKGKASGVNIQQADSQDAAPQNDKFNSKKVRPLMDSDIKQLMDVTTSALVHSSNQRIQSSNWGPQQLQSTSNLSTNQSSVIPNLALGYPISGVIGDIGGTMSF